MAGADSRCDRSGAGPLRIRLTSPFLSLLAELPLRSLPGVESVTPVLKPYKLASREFAVANHFVAVSTNAERVGAIAGVPLLSGFFSKDEILWKTYESGHIVLWVLAVLTAFLTATYMFRLVFIAFLGPEKSEAAGHAHESPRIMVLPLLVLAVPAGYGLARFQIPARETIFLILLAGLQSLPVEPFEAARVDGASEIRIAWSIKIPAVRPALLLTVTGRRSP